MVGSKPVKHSIGADFRTIPACEAGQISDPIKFMHRQMKKNTLEFCGFSETP